VQSVALRLIVEREREIKNFSPSIFYRVFATLAKNGEKAEFEVIQINGKDIEIEQKFNLYDGEYRVRKTIIETEEQAQKILALLSKEKIRVGQIKKQETKRSPYPPFITSTLAQEASRRFYFSSKKTMLLAQELYEHGFITYHRTDSFSLSPLFLSSARKFIKENFGEKYLAEKARVFKTRSKVAQEAHEAIRPTNPNTTHEEVSKSLGRDAGRLYELIWRRALASQAAEAIFETTTVFAKTQSLLLKTTGSRLLFDGFLKILMYEEKETKLPEFHENEPLVFVDGRIQEGQTAPPPRYNEASLIASLEKNGIGRPSTYATIIATLEERHYVEREEKRFVPTAVGIAVNDFLVQNFSEIDDIPFTAQMEEELDQIARGEKKWRPMISEFYDPFDKKLKDAQSQEKIALPVEKTGKKCPNCGSEIVVKIGRFGKFLACSQFPKCNYTAPFVQETNFPCPKDGGKIVVKKTKRGRKFYACSNYPKCDFAAWRLEEINKS
jgi:DNA topoisomerase-1